MQTRIVGFSALLLLVAGCTSTKTLSNRDPFYDYVGRSVELLRPVTVVERPKAFGGDVLASRYTKYGLLDSHHRYNQMYQKVAELPVGHRVQIDSVCEEIQMDFVQIIAYGRTTIPPSTEEVQFAYPWSSDWILWPAPWEPADTPARRGPPGRLPAHFDYPMFYPPPGTPKWGTKVKE